MKSSFNTEARKRPVNLTLNEDLVREARGLTGNLSQVVEGLLADYVAREHATRAEREREYRAAAAVWNAFDDKHGSFADEHSTL